MLQSQTCKRQLLGPFTARLPYVSSNLHPLPHTSSFPLLFLLIPSHSWLVTANALLCNCVHDLTSLSQPYQPYCPHMPLYLSRLPVPGSHASWFEGPISSCCSVCPVSSGCLNLPGWQSEPHTLPVPITSPFPLPPPWHITAIPGKVPRQAAPHFCTQFLPWALLPLPQHCRLKPVASSLPTASPPPQRKVAEEPLPFCWALILLPCCLPSRACEQPRDICRGLAQPQILLATTQSPLRPKHLAPTATAEAFSTISTEYSQSEIFPKTCKLA